VSVLSERETHALLHLARYRYLTRSQLQDFLFESSLMVRASQEVVSQRILRRLTAERLVVAVSRPSAELGGSTARRAYVLTRAGYARAAALGPGLPAWRPALRSTLQLSHGLVTADVALTIRRAARATRGHAVLEWELDRAAAARLGSSSVIPDAFLVYATLACELHACVEIDLDTERPTVFAEKIRHYLDLYRNGTWRTAVRAWPVVATITPTEARARTLHRTTEAVLAAEPDAERMRKVTEFDVAPLSDVLGSLGPFGAIWRVAGRTGLHRLIPEELRAEAGDDATRTERWPTVPRGVERCVYVIELADVETPRTTPFPCVYVGQSAYSAEIRFAQHKSGYKASRFVRRNGMRLRPDLCADVPCTPDWHTALHREGDLAKRLGRAGYCVHGGH